MVAPAARSAAVVLLVSVVALSACTGSTRPAPGTHSVAPTTSRPGPSGVAPFADHGVAGCRPASPITSTSNGPEVRGTSTSATLYGLLMAMSTSPIRVGEQVKIVWRMTGSGPLRLTATNPAGKRVALVFGPEQHGGSNYQRPGQEWGSGYEFTSPGCWRLHAARTTGVADVWVRVAAR